MKLSDVAKHAGMSPATASRALRGMKVHKNHQGKAEAAAAELGYVLNEHARALRSEKTMTVGMAFHDLTSMLGMELLSALTSGLDEAGYSVFISTAQGQDDKFDQLVNRFLQRRVDALVCVNGRGTGAALEGFKAVGIPVMALISKSGGYAGLPLVSPTTAEASLACVTRLKDLGHASIAVLTPERLTTPLRNLMQTAEEQGLRVQRYEQGGGTFDPKAFLRAYLAEANPPTVLAARQGEAQRLLDAANTQGVAVPGDLSMVSIRDRTSAAAPEALSSIHVNPRPIGQAAASLLKAWLAGGPPVATDQQVEDGFWIERDTTGPADR